MFVPDPSFSIPDPGSKRFRNSDPRSGSISKNLLSINPKQILLSSRKYDPGCSSRIQIYISYPSRNQGSKRHHPGSATRQLHVLPEIHAVLHDGIVDEVGMVHSLPHVHHAALDGEVDLVSPQSLHGLALKKVNKVDVNNNTVHQEDHHKIHIFYMHCYFKTQI
jgi:hypothetical protein